MLFCIYLIYMCFYWIGYLFYLQMGLAVAKPELYASDRRVGDPQPLVITTLLPVGSEQMCQQLANDTAVADHQ